MEESHQVKGSCLRERFEMSERDMERELLVREHANSRATASVPRKQQRALACHCSRSSQSSLEYLLVVALTFAIIVPTTYLFYSYSKESSQEITDAQVTKLGRSIVDAAESIFYSGQGSKTVLELNVPDNIGSALIIDGRELVFNVTTSFGVSEVVFFSSVNLTAISQNCIANTCKLPELASSGLKKVKIEAVSKDSVRIEVI